MTMPDPCHHFLRGYDDDHIDADDIGDNDVPPYVGRAAQAWRQEQAWRGTAGRYAARPTAPTPAAAAAPAARVQAAGITAAELDVMEFPPIRYVVPGYITEGITILAGRPKLGKSWLCLDLAVAVASGGITLGSVAC